jgi:hypothetical protein
MFTSAFGDEAAAKVRASTCPLMTVISTGICDSIDKIKHRIGSTIFSGGALSNQRPTALPCRASRKELFRPVVARKQAACITVLPPLNLEKPDEADPPLAQSANCHLLTVPNCLTTENL